jgi:hypothetical protein
MAEVEEILSQHLATRVHVMLGKRRGKVVIEVDSKEDLDRIVSRIAGTP